MSSCQEKLTPLLKLKYHNAIADAFADRGGPEEIAKLFAGFQKYLYQHAAAAPPALTLSGSLEERR